MHAVERVLSIAKSANRGYGRKWVALVTVDIKNAFNSASWRKIVESLEAREISTYLVECMKQYLTDRSVLVDHGQTIMVTAGVLQGSVLGPTLWNVVYDGIMEVDVPDGTTLICYADDLAMVITAADERTLKYKIEDALDIVWGWIARNELEIAQDKTEVVLLTDRRRPKPMSFQSGGHVITPNKYLRYLGIIVDGNMTFGEHIRKTCEKAGKAVAALRRLMPNIGGPTSQKRKMLWEAAKSILLYGAPVWKDVTKIKKYKVEMEQVQRKMLIRICSACRTASNESLQVIAGVPPIHLLVEERAYIRAEVGGSNEEGRKRARGVVIAKWEELWDEPTTGKWTKELIRTVGPWHHRKHGNVNYHISQILKSWVFQSYTYWIKKTSTGTCMYCPDIDSRHSGAHSV